MVDTTHVLEATEQCDGPGLYHNPEEVLIALALVKKLVAAGTAWNLVA